jgi:hypothetical protein
MYADSGHSGNVAGFHLIPRAGVRRPGNADNGKASARRAVICLIGIHFLKIDLKLMPLAGG